MQSLNLLKGKRMKKLMTIKDFAEKKNQFMRLANQEIDDEQRLVYCNAVDFCDRKIGQILARRRELIRRMLIIVILTVIGVIVGACQTVDGFRQDIHKLTETPKQMMEK